MVLSEILILIPCLHRTTFTRGEFMWATIPYGPTTLSAQVDHSCAATSRTSSTLLVLSQLRLNGCQGMVLKSGATFLEDIHSTGPRVYLRLKSVSARSG